MLELRNVCKTYKSKKGSNCAALKGINIKFPDSGMVFILGKSGSGKSTLLNIIGGLDAADEGEIIIKGKSSKDFTAKDYDSYRNTYLGFIFQEFNVLDGFNIYDNIALALRLQGKKADNVQINNILSQVGLEGFEKRNINEISGGQRQRVAIARALVKNPDIIFGDEPTGNLDSNTSAQVFDILKNLAKKRLVVIVSHDRESAEKYADRIIELSDGVVISDVSRTDSESRDFNISDNVITIPNNRNLTKEELKQVNKKIQTSKEDDEKVEIKYSRLAKFRKTQKVENNKTDGFKLIKSRFPNRYATHMGISNFKSKPFRLIVTIFLTMVALALFGLSQIFAGYDLPSASSHSFKNNGISQIILKQGEYSELYDSFNYSVENVITTQSELAIGQIYKGKTNSMYGIDFQLGDIGSAGIMDMLLAVMGKDITSPYKVSVKGIMQAELEDLTRFFGEVSMISSAYPDSTSNAVAITDYLADALLENDMVEDNNADSVIDYNDIIGYNMTDTFQFKIEVGGIIKTNYKEKYKNIIDSYATNPSDFTNHEDYAAFSNDVINYYSLFFTKNENLIADYVVPNTNASKVSRFKYRKPDAEYESLATLSENSLSSTGYMFKKQGFFDLFGLEEGTDPANTMADKVFSAGALQKLSESDNAIIISVEAFNMAFGTEFKTKDDFVLSNYQIDELRLKLGTFDLLAEEPDAERDVVVVGVYSFSTELLAMLESMGLSDPTVLTTLFKAFASDEMIESFNTENYGKKGLYIELGDDVAENTRLLRAVNNNYMYHVSELSTTVYMVSNIFDIFSIIFQWVALILGIFSVILLFNFVSLSVVNKQKDIGILRAIGAKGTDVSKIFLIETLIMGAITVVFAWLLIWLGTMGVNQLLLGGFTSYMQSTTIQKVALLSVGVWPLVAVLIACIGVTLIATIIPTIRISRMKPVDAIKKV